MVILLQSCSTSLRTWLESRTVAPSPVMRRIWRRKTESMTGSRPALGSSRRYRRAGRANAAIRAAFWRLPFE